MKFSIRDLFLVTFCVALAVGWWVDHRRQVFESDMLRLELRAHKIEQNLGGDFFNGDEVQTVIDLLGEK